MNLDRCTTEAESHEQFTQSYYKTKLMAMQRNSEHAQYNAAIMAAYNRALKRLNDLKKAIEIEDAKRYVDSYLLFSKSWCESEIQKMHRKLIRLIKLYKS